MLLEWDGERGCVWSAMATLCALDFAVKDTNDTNPSAVLSSRL